MSHSVNTGDHFVPGIDAAHERIHDGENFLGSDIVAAVNDAASREFLIITGTLKVHLTFDISVEGKSNLFLFEGTVVSGNGTVITLFNSNRSSSKTAGLQFFHTPTITTDETQILGRILQAGEVQKGVAATSQRNEIILAASTNYLVRITNNSGSQIDIGTIIDFYEIGAT